MDRARVVIVGGGFAGLNAAKGLKSAPVDVLLIDKTNCHVFQPLLYQVATAALSPGNIAAPLRQVLAHQENASVLLADIAAISTQTKEVVAVNGERFAYDYLILAPGARHSYFGHPQWETFAPGLKTLHDATQIRENILLSYERAERSSNPEEAQKLMRFVIIGAGPTGVEMAGAIAEIANRALRRNFRNIKPEQSMIYLIEGQGQVLASFPKDLADRAQRDLEKLGVEVRLNTIVTDVTAEGIRMGDNSLETKNVIWAAGNEVPSFLRTLGAPVDRMGRVVVQPDLTIPNHPEIFVIGDAANCSGAQGKPLPGIAPTAIQQGRYVAKLIRSQTNVASRKPFKYFDKGMMATIGKAKAVAMTGSLKMTGRLAWLAWCLIHVLYLITFANRLFVMMHWFYLYIFNQRRIRLIVQPIIEKRQDEL